VISFSYTLNTHCLPVGHVHLFPETMIHNFNIAKGIKRYSRTALFNAQGQYKIKDRKKAAPAVCCCFLCFMLFAFHIFDSFETFLLTLFFFQAIKVAQPVAPKKYYPTEILPKRTVHKYRYEF